MDSKKRIREYLLSADIIRSGDDFTISEKNDGESLKIYQKKGGRVFLLLELYRDDLD